MNRLTYLFLLFVGLLVASCGDDETGTLSIAPQANYQGAALQLNQEVDYEGMPLRFQRISFYMTDINLIKDGERTEISDAEYVNLPESASSYSLSVEGIEAGTYDGIEFNLGLTPAVNATVPADYPADNPLSEAGEYWSAWGSYVYAKIEGRADPDGDGQLDLSLAYHMGGDEAVAAVSLNTPVEITADGTATLNLSFDLADVLKENGQAFDIEALSRTHSLDHKETMNMFMSNWASSMSVN